MAENIYCECSIDINTEEIVKCPLCEAAPDMYEALLQLCSNLSINCSMDYLYKHNLSLPLAKGQRVLAKAEGKE